MQGINFQILPPPAVLQNEVVCIRTVNYDGGDAFAIRTALNGLPGIVLQHCEGRSPVERITTPSHSNAAIPPLYLYGQITEPSVIDHQGPYTMTQVLLKPHALRTLFGFHAPTVTNRIVEFDEVAPRELGVRLLESPEPPSQVALLTDFLIAKLQQANTRDTLIEEGLRLIHHHRGALPLKSLLAHLSISERHFARRFVATVGLSPHFYMRVQRFKEALRLMKTRRYARLTEVAHALDFHDESHMIRDIKAFSGMTPKTFAQMELAHHDTHDLHERAGYFSV